MAVPTQFAFRTSKGIGITDASPVYQPLQGFEKPEGNLRCCVYSPDGRYFAWASTESVTIVNASDGQVVNNLPVDNIYELGFSPLGTYVITWQRPSKTETGDATKNLVVWKVAQSGDGSSPEENIMGRFVQKNQTGWNLQYTQDEKYCARAVTNEIQFYESGDLATVWNKLRVEGVQDFALSPGQTNSVAVFVPEKKGNPAAVKIFNVPSFTSPVSQKTFFKGDKVQLKWNQNGTSLIVLAQTDVDKSGKSYYGETTLYLLSAGGGFDSRIDLDKEGPIHDVTWSPNSKEFGVVYGYMPAKTTIFDSKAVATHSFPLSPRNTILFSPHGKFVLVAGFGNLAGQIDMYDLEKDYFKICTMQASNASVCEWSPDGLYILTATTSPRLRVDNGVRVWHVGGSLMYNEDMTELYHVTWRPESAEKHLLPADPVKAAPEPHPSALEYLGKVKTPSKPAGAYRPPGARGTTTPLAFMREDQGGAAYVSDGSLSLGNGASAFGKPRRREVPGAEVVDELKGVPGVTGADGGDENLSKAALKNKKKREAKKAKEAAEKTAGLTAENAGITSPSPGNRNRSPSGRNRSPGRSPERRGFGGQGGQDKQGGQAGEGVEGRGYQNRDGGRNRERNRSRTNSELRPRSQNRRGNGPQGERRGPTQHPSRNGDPSRNGEQAASGAVSGTNGAGPRINTVVAQEVPTAAPDLTVTTPGGGSAQDKKIRALTKKLRAIDDLKMRRAGGEKLEGTQIKKMDTEDQVRQELEGLGWNDE